VAFSADLRRWDTPQRLVFEPPTTAVRYTYARAEPLERTYNVVAVRRGYAMLLAQGFVRLSDDLRTWSPPSKVIPQDLSGNRLVKGGDGTVWAVYENSSPERQPYTSADSLHGYFVVDGKQYRHLTELRVSRSVDGITWKEAGNVTFPGQPSALWAFAIGDRRIGVAVGFNNLSMRWLEASSSGDLRQVDSELPMSHQFEEAEWYVRDGGTTCVRPVFDPERQKPMLLSTGTARIWGSGESR
jgi:hypothetical protein